jgi:hypothetical protein
MMTTTPHWPQVQPRTGNVGVGAAAPPNPQNRAEINAVTDMIAFFDSNGCTRASLPVVKVFQIAYNQSGLPGRLTEDGQYGGNTERAAQNTLDEAQADAGAGPSQQAPANCFGMAVPATPGLDPAPPPAPHPGGGPVTPTTPTTSASSSNTAWWLIGSAAAVGATALGVAYYRKRHRR